MIRNQATKRAHSEAAFNLLQSFFKRRELTRVKVCAPSLSTTSQLNAHLDSLNALTHDMQRAICHRPSFIPP
jgi:hypothetical protein